MPITTCILIPSSPPQHTTIFIPHPYNSVFLTLNVVGEELPFFLYFIVDTITAVPIYALSAHLHPAPAPLPSGCPTLSVSMGHAYMFFG